jgi:cell division septation protein DedD
MPMDTGLKQRLIGAAVLVALAVIFLPMLVKGPAPDSGAADVSLDIPKGPEGEIETRDLPLVRPGEVPEGGVVGMNAQPLDGPTAAPAGAIGPATGDPKAASDPADTAGASTATAGSLTPDQPASSDPTPPPTTAGGDYAVHFGAYASAKGAETVVALAKAAQLPAYSEPTTLGGKPAWRVRIGPYATRAEAEAVRVKALTVRSDVPVRVVTLDAAPAAAPQVSPPFEGDAPTAPRPTPAPQPKPAETKPVVASVKPAESKPLAPKPPDVKPAEAKPAPLKPVAASPKPAAPAAGAGKVGFAVQLGAFSDAAEAGALRERLRAAGFTAFTESVNTDKGKLTRVRVGPVLDRAAADQLKSQIQAKTGVDGIVRPHP